MSFPAYPEYQDSGIAWVGEMPVHWGVKQLKWLFDLQKRPVRDKDEIVTAFRDGIVTLRKLRREEGFTNSLKEIGYQGIRKGDLVIHAMDGFAGAIGVSDADGKSTPVYSVCKPNEGSLADYYGRLLRYMALSGFVVSLAKGVRERSTEFRWRDASVLPLPVPPLSEQRAIVQFLDRETAKIDALVAEQKRLIALLKEKRQAVISHAVTKGLDREVPIKDSGIEWLGEIPAHWEVGPIKRYCKSLDGKRIPLSAEERGSMQGEYPYYGASGIIDHVDDYIFDEPLVLVSEDGANLLMRNYRIAFVATGQFWVNNHAHILKPFDGQVGFWADRIEVLDITPVVTGAAQPKLTSDALANLRVAVPSDAEERAAIAMYVEAETEAFRPLMEEAQQAIELLRERRAALISAAVTGKIDVRGLFGQHEIETA